MKTKEELKKIISTLNREEKLLIYTRYGFKKLMDKKVIKPVDGSCPSVELTEDGIEMAKILEEEKFSPTLEEVKWALVGIHTEYE